MSYINNTGGSFHEKGILQVIIVHFFSYSVQRATYTYLGCRFIMLEYGFMNPSLGVLSDSWNTRYIYRI